MPVAVMDPRAGFISMEVYWRPKIGAPNPNRPGEKVSISMFRPCEPDASCYCGSGRDFQDCCQNRKQWPVVTPDPGAMSFSHAQAHSSVYPIHAVAKLRQTCMADPRLQCIIDGPGEAGFWLFVDDPPIENSYGRVNFADLEIKGGRLSVTAMSAKRHEVVQKFLTEIAENFLGTAFVKVHPPHYFDKPAGPQLMEIKSPPRSQLSGRSKRPGRNKRGK